MFHNLTGKDRYIRARIFHNIAGLISGGIKEIVTK